MNFLQLNGIMCSTNQYPPSEAPVIESWPQLWVSESDLPKANELINTLLTEESDIEQNWVCPNCLEELEGVFVECWNCGISREE